jgi:fluoride exporter
MAPTDERSLHARVPSLSPSVEPSARLHASESTARSSAGAVAVFPWSTFAINISGCLLIGAVISALVDRHHLPGWMRIGLVMGVLGGYTTFATYAQESLDLLREGQAGVATLYAAGSVLTGILAVYAGTLVGRLL